MKTNWFIWILAYHIIQNFQAATEPEQPMCVMRAEAMLLRGADEEAEALCLCAELILARIAILRGDADAYDKSIKHIKNYASARPERFLVRMSELCLSLLSLTLGNTKGFPEWLYDPEKIKKILYAPALPLGNMLYANILLIDKKYNDDKTRS